MAASISAEFPRWLDKSNIYVCVILYLYHFLSSKVNPRGSDIFVPTYSTYVPTTLFPFHTKLCIFPKYVITD